MQTLFPLCGITVLLGEIILHYSAEEDPWIWESENCYSTVEADLIIVKNLKNNNISDNLTL